MEQQTSFYKYKDFTLEELCMLLTETPYDQPVVRAIHLLEHKGLLRTGDRKEGYSSSKTYYFNVPQNYSESILHFSTDKASPGRLFLTEQEQQTRVGKHYEEMGLALDNVWTYAFAIWQNLPFEIHSEESKNALWFAENVIRPKINELRTLMNTHGLFVRAAIQKAKLGGKEI